MADFLAGSGIPAMSGWCPGMQITLGSCPSRTSTAAMADLSGGVPTTSWGSAMKAVAALLGPRRQQKDPRWRLGHGSRRRRDSE
uniref:Uncharacterized protein n=1 Tax=Aegilops tauschii TaxID=37682 RepID=M8BKS4_AEGTA